MGDALTHQQMRSRSWCMCLLVLFTWKEHPMIKYLVGTLFGICLGLTPAATGKAIAKDDGRAHVLSVVSDLERELGARIGISVRHGETGQEWSYRGDDRFALTSTFKAFACAALLARVDARQDLLSRRVAFSRADLVTYSPATEKHADGDGMSLGELCAATLRTSDNTAGNLILDAIGGPSGFTEFMRAVGDRQTRIDRRETALNEAVPGDPRDTTTPNSATASLKAIVLGGTLGNSSREQLTRWMADNAFAGPLLRSSLPAGWRIADRTGAGGHGARSIIGVIWPDKSAPQVVAIYLAETSATMEQRNRAIAKIGAALVASYAQN
jgi:beta-lactamase class A